QAHRGPRRESCVLGRDVDADTGQRATGVQDGRRGDCGAGRKAAEEADVEGGRPAAVGHGAGGHDGGGRDNTAERPAEGAVQLAPDGEAPAAVFARLCSEKFACVQRGSAGATSSMKRRIDASVSSCWRPPKFIQQITDGYPASWSAVSRSVTSAASPAIATSSSRKSTKSSSVPSAMPLTMAKTL